MIKHSLNDNLIHVSIENKDFSYRIPLKKIGKTIHWKIGEKGSSQIVMQNVSTMTLKLFTKNVMDDKYIEQFKAIVQEYAPQNSINWKETLLAVNVQNEYNSRVASNATSDKKLNDDEILSILEGKYDLP